VKGEELGVAVLRGPPQSGAIHQDFQVVGWVLKEHKPVATRASGWKIAP